MNLAQALAVTAAALVVALGPERTTRLAVSVPFTEAAFWSWRGLDELSRPLRHEGRAILSAAAIRFAAPPAERIAARLKTLHCRTDADGQNYRIEASISSGEPARAHAG